MDDQANEPAGDGATADLREWTEGVCGDGAAILCDGMRVSIPDILDALNDRERLLAAMRKIAKMKPTEIAPETFPGLVHGPALLFDNCRRVANVALKGKRYA